MLPSAFIVASSIAPSGNLKFSLELVTSLDDSYGRKPPMYQTVKIAMTIAIKKVSMV